MEGSASQGVCFSNIGALLATATFDYRMLKHIDTVLCKLVGTVTVLCKVVGVLVSTPVVGGVLEKHDCH